jgi:hypothetical protein
MEPLTEDQMARLTHHELVARLIQVNTCIILDSRMKIMMCAQEVIRQLHRLVA